MNIFKATLVGASLALLTATASYAQDVTLRVQHFISNKGAIPANFILPWAEKIEADSNGRIKVEVYPAMQLGGTPPMVYDQIKDNVIDAGWAIPGYTPGRFPGSEVFELPFMTSTSAEGSSKAAWDFYEKYLQDEFSEVKVIAVHVHGSGAIHTKGVEVKSTADLDGLKLRAPTRISSKVLEALGATAVGMPVPQLPEALSKGVVDGGIIPFEIVPPLKIHELATSHTEISGNRAFYNTFFVFGMNKSAYDRMPDDLKAIIDANSGAMASEWAGRAMDIGDGPGKQLTAASGNPIHTLSADDIAAMESVTTAVIDEWIAEMNAKGYDGAQMVADARAMVAAYD